jgi:3-hydroxybutyryl-CoA dehydrogenase
MAKDTPGFIVNRIARPFYGEAIRILEEGLANIATIDWAMKEIGGFPMGPFELMDYIGHDVNYIVTETVFKEFFFDPRYKPSFSQKRLIEAKRLGRKTGHGFYNYTEKKRNPSPLVNQELGTRIVNRIVCLLINEAIDACFLNIASEKDIDLAMTKGVNYPKGLLTWANEKGLTNVLAELEELFYTYGEDRYRPSPLLKKMENENLEFFS